MGWFGLEEDVNPSRPSPRPLPVPHRNSLSFPPFGSRPLSPHTRRKWPEANPFLLPGVARAGARRAGRAAAGGAMPATGRSPSRVRGRAGPPRGPRGGATGATGPAWLGLLVTPPCRRPETPRGGAPAGVAGGGRAVREPPRPPPGARAPAAPAGHRGRRRARRHAKGALLSALREAGRAGAGPPSVLPSGASCGLAPPALGSPAGVRTAGDLVGGWGQRAKAGKPGGGGLTGPTRAPPPSSPPACRAGR